MSFRYQRPFETDQHYAEECIREAVRISEEEKESIRRKKEDTDYYSSVPSEPSIGCVILATLGGIFVGACLTAIFQLVPQLSFLFPLGAVLGGIFGFIIGYLKEFK